jgi:predicted nucleic-acid-binding Zn-ribbon protein
MKRCPKCGCEKFYVTAHVVEGWLVDADGEYLRTTETCVEVTHYPDNEDLWTCFECGYEEEGIVFEKEEK